MSGGLKKREQKKNFLFQYNFLAHGFHIKLLTLADIYLQKKPAILCVVCYDIVVHNKFINKLKNMFMSMNNTS